ncbi:hypothetical protein CPB85DRAFT_1248578 [Mucidula mucida]|nr:hypothetical protein CPB85DRAFT_1248578 [Mucidula mucida]
MSFAGTPLGQGRRLDHSSFLGKAPTTDRPIPTSYSFGAPTLGPRSPPKATSARERPKSATDHDDAQLTTRPEKWSVKDTSVNIASAFHQAASDMSSTNHNAAWASGSTRTSTVPRSTSVDYETVAPAARRFPAPPKRLGSSTAVPGRGLTKSVSATIVPDSEGEDSQQPTRGKTPLRNMVENVAAYYVRQRSQDPPEHLNNISGSFEYSQEERDFQDQKRKGNHKRGGISADNKAYKPSMSDLEDDDEDFADDDNGRKRRAKKKEVGRVSNLPTIGETRRRKKKPKTPKAAGQPESADEEEEDQQSAHGSHRSSAAPRPSSRATSNHHNSIPPPDLFPDTNLSIESLQAIPEHDEDSSEDHSPPRRASSIGASIGKSINKTFHGIGNVLDAGNSGVSGMFWFCGRVLGVALNQIFLRPLGWLLQGSFNGFFRYLVVALVILGAWQYIPGSFTDYIPSLPSRSYHAPNVPAADVSEFNDRLLRIENTLSALSKDSDRTKSKVDTESRIHSEVVNRLGTLETKVQKENARAAEAEDQYRDAASRAMQELKKEMSLLQSKVHTSPSSEGGSDEEARAKLKYLEEHLHSIEGGVKEALELAKAGAKAGSAVASLSWINNLDKKGLTIKSSDGKDVTNIIAQLVKSALSIQNKDMLAKPDYALSSTGGRVIPGQTSPSVEIMIPEGGTGIGRPPIFALHPDLHAGQCWPFGGSSGKLGVALAAPVYISEVTIDHVSKEVAHDMRTAPRAMEVWGQIDGKDNVQKIAAWRAEKQNVREEALKRGETIEEDVHPKDYPAKLWVKIASFNYNIHDSNPIQTFPVFEEIRKLNVDFGIVNLRILNNWGREDYTCLYRFRVHGEPLRAPPPPLSEDVLKSS